MRAFIRRLFVTLAVGVGVLAVVAAALTSYVLLAWNRPVRRPIVAMTAPRDAQHVARGKYLYESSMLCWDCHSAGEAPGPGQPQSGGREFDMTHVGPGFGFVYGTNVTSDPDTGVGAWSDGELVRAIREGLGRDGRVIFPVMAYQFYHGVSDDDALSLVAYMRTLPRVRNRVPAARLSFAAKAILAFGIAGAEPAITAPAMAPPKGPTAEYGRYLAWHASGCAECHTPRDPQTAKVDFTRPMAGGLFPFPEPLFTTIGSNLTLDAGTGLGGWTHDQFAAAVQNGIRPNGKVLLPFMPWPAYSRWERDDIDAVWAYLQSISPVAHAVPASRLVDAPAGARVSGSGEAIYGAYCVMCHGVNGAGSSFTTAPLKATARDLDDEMLRSAIAEGVPGTIMPAFGGTLSNGQIREIVAAIRKW